MLRSGEAMVGSGFLVDLDGGAYLMTAAHVAFGGNHPTVAWSLWAKTIQIPGNVQLPAIELFDGATDERQPRFGHCSNGESLIIDDYAAGASTHELANRCNVRRNTVRDTLRRAGFDLTVKAKRAALSEEQKAEARRLFASGATRRELMEMYGVSESTIRRALRSSVELTMS